MDAPGIFHDIDCSGLYRNPFPSQNADSDWLRTSGCQGQNIAEYKNKSYNERLQNIRGRTGYVGLSMATLLSQHHHVTAVDVIPEKVEMINSRRSPIQDEYIERYLAEKPLDLTATLDGRKAYSRRRLRGHRRAIEAIADIPFLEEAAHTFAGLLQEGAVKQDVPHAVHGAEGGRGPSSSSPTRTSLSG